MKVYRVSDADNADIPKEHRKKIALLKLAETRVIVKGVGMRDGEFYLVIENEKDREYLDLKLLIDSKIEAYDMNLVESIKLPMKLYFDIQTSIKKQKAMLT